MSRQIAGTTSNARAGSIDFGSKILFLGAHCDDIEIGCGGTAAKLSSRGHQIAFAVAADCGHARMAEARAAAAILGLTEANGRLVFGSIPDTRLEERKSELRLWLKLLLDRFNPETVFAHRRDAHSDHQAVYDVATQVFESKKVLLFYIPKALPEPAFVPRYVEDITAQIVQKLAMCACHATQAGKGIYLDPAEIERNASHFFKQTFPKSHLKGYAEAFEIHMLHSGLAALCERTEQGAVAQPFDGSKELAGPTRSRDSSAPLGASTWTTDDEPDLDPAPKGTSGSAVDPETWKHPGRLLALLLCFVLLIVPIIYVVHPLSQLKPDMNEQGQPGPEKPLDERTQLTFAMWQRDMQQWYISNLEGEVLFRAGAVEKSREKFIQARQSARLACDRVELHTEAFFPTDERGNRSSGYKNLANSCINYGITLIESGDRSTTNEARECFEEAGKALKQADEIRPNWYEIELSLGRALFGLAQVASAEGSDPRACHKSAVDHFKRADSIYRSERNGIRYWEAVGREAGVHASSSKWLGQCGHTAESESAWRMARGLYEEALVSPNLLAWSDGIPEYCELLVSHGETEHAVEVLKIAKRRLLENPGDPFDGIQTKVDNLSLRLSGRIEPTSPDKAK